MPNSTITKRMSIVALTWPIFIETALRMGLSTADIFMLSAYSDKAVAAVGLITQVMFLLIIMSMMVSTGAGILISQYNGAEKPARASEVSVVAIYMTLALGVFLGAVMYFGADLFLSWFELEPAVSQFGFDYLVVTGSCALSLAMGVTLSTILRANGYSRSPMVVNLIAGGINIIGNYFALFGPFGLPIYGVTGVAIATVFSQVFSAAVLGWVIYRKGIHVPLHRVAQIPKHMYFRVFRIGALNAGEMLSYNLAQMTIIYFISQMGTASLTAYTYAQNIGRLTFTFSLALGQGTQIQTGYYVGKSWLNEISVRVQRYFFIGFAVSLTIVLLFVWQRFNIAQLFTDNAEIVELTALLLVGSVFLETGRVFNLVFISGLKGAGDVAYPVKVGLICMWGVGVGLAWFLGLHLGWGVIGAWLAIGADEWVRGLIMTKRWRSGEWRKFAFTGLS
ncbi:MATE family efflux transporter [Alginatibacterium sediminis]|nr:MATE family efflux transporter [Alginatibacterium sediminis]